MTFLFKNLRFVSWIDPMCSRFPWDQSVVDLVKCNRISTAMSLFSFLMVISFMSIVLIQNKKIKWPKTCIFVMSLFFLGATIIAVKLSDSRAVSMFENYRIRRQDMMLQGLSPINIIDLFSREI